MENQISGGDQNIKQIGRNPINQYSIPQGKPKVNYWMISTIILGFLFLVMTVVFLFGAKLIEKTTPIVSAPKLSVTPTNNEAKNIYFTLDTNIEKEIATVSSKLKGLYQSNDNDGLNTLKKELLKSDNISLITLGSAINFIPAEHINIYIDRLDSLGIPSAGIELTQEQYDRFINTISKNTIDDSRDDPYKYLSIDTQSWYYWEIVQNHEHFMKNGILCQIVNSWCGSGGSLKEQCTDIYKQDKKDYWLKSNSGECCRAVKTNRWQRISCINARELEKNNFAYSRELVYKVLAEGGVNCQGMCLEPINDYTIAHLPQYARNITYKEESAPQNKSIKYYINELRRQRVFFSLTGWQTEFNDRDFNGLGEYKLEEDLRQNPSIQKILVAKNKVYECNLSLYLTLDDNDKITKLEKNLHCQYNNNNK